MKKSRLSYLSTVLQFAVLLIAFPMIANVGITAIGGFEGLMAKIPASHMTLPNTPRDIINYLFMFIVFAIPFLDPAATQRILMGKNSAQVRKTFCWSALIETPIYICVGIIGLIAVITSPGFETNLAFGHLVNTVLPVGLKGIAVAGLLAVVMSSADSYLNSAGITLVHDTLKPLFGNAVITEKMELRMTQIATFILGTLATVIAFCFDSIMGIMLFSFNFWVPIVVVPLYAGLLGMKHLTSKNFIVGAIAGTTVFFIWYFFLEKSLGISATLPSMIANGIAFFVSNKLQRAPRAIEEKVFSVATCIKNEA